MLCCPILLLAVRRFLPYDCQLRHIAITASISGRLSVDRPARLVDFQMCGARKFNRGKPYSRTQNVRRSTSFKQERPSYKHDPKAQLDLTH